MIRSQVLKHLPRARKGEGGESKGDFRRGAMEKSRYVRVVEGEEVRRGDPIDPRRVGSTV